MNAVEIIAKEGMWLTQATLENEDNRIFAKRLTTSDASQWRDATDEEKLEWEAEHPIPTPPEM